MPRARGRNHTSTHKLGRNRLTTITQLAYPFCEPILAGGWDISALFKPLAVYHFDLVNPTIIRHVVCTAPVTLSHPYLLPRIQRRPWISSSLRKYEGVTPEMPGPSTIATSSFYSSRPTFNGVPRGHPLAGLASSAILGSPDAQNSSASSSSLGASSRPQLGQLHAQTPSGSFARKRSASPEPTDPTDTRPSKMQRPAALSGMPGLSGNSFTRIKSESEIEAQFGGTGPVIVTGQQGQGGERRLYRRDDTPGLVGKGYLREQLAKHRKWICAYSDLCGLE